MPVSLTRLARRLRARVGRDGDDRGAVAATVGLLLGSGVLLGMAALVVDVGLIYAERGQLQAGADAAAVAVAQACATDPTGCSPDGRAVDAVAGRFADENANDGQAAAEVCGRGGGLTDCAAPARNLADCVTAAPAAGPYVEVHTGTRRDGNQTLLPPVFARAVLPDYDGAQVRACARAVWGGPSRAEALALAVPECEWGRLTTGGTSYPASPGDLAVRDAPAACGAGGDGLRWLADDNDDCRGVFTVDDQPSAAPADPADDHGCGDALARVSGQPVLLPVVAPGPSAGGWTVRGFAAFVVSGWKVPGNAGGTPCDTGATPCVSGRFTTQLLPGGGATGGPDYGARVVALAG
ncbi:pilus assembly protein TadG-related protein [Micromonospora sp. NPDC000089]|uniref:pilus assembly protein TadG-related protein n=1 Tax=unclassified Micromonospora TaxID=2617518 RepID=UPI0036CDE3FD